MNAPENPQQDRIDRIKEERQRLWAQRKRLRFIRDEDTGETFVRSMNEDQTAAFLRNPRFTLIR